MGSEVPYRSALEVSEFTGNGKSYTSFLCAFHFNGIIYKYQGVKEFHMLARIGSL